MRLVSNVWVLFLATMLLVACSGDDKKKDDTNTDTNGDELSLAFSDLANFKPTEKPTDFKVSIHKG